VADYIFQKSQHDAQKKAAKIKEEKELQHVWLSFAYFRISIAFLLLSLFVSVSDSITGFTWFLSSSSRQARCQNHAAWPISTAMEVQCFAGPPSYNSSYWSHYSRRSSY
jgi:hypothetical protein